MVVFVFLVFAAFSHFSLIVSLFYEALRSTVALILRVAYRYALSHYEHSRSRRWASARCCEATLLCVYNCFLSLLRFHLEKIDLVSLLVEKTSSGMFISYFVVHLVTKPLRAFCVSTVKGEHHLVCNNP